jgi:hypothetical protein
LELKALLEITQAITENQSEEVLLTIFKFTCLVHLNIKALILYVSKEGDYEQRIKHGLKGKIPSVLPASWVVDDKQSGNLSLQLADGYSFKELETYLPVYHKDHLLAILFLKTKSNDQELDLDFTQALANILVVALENKRFARRQLEQEVLKQIYLMVVLVLIQFLILLHQTEVVEVEEVHKLRKVIMVLMVVQVVVLVEVLQLLLVVQVTHQLQFHLRVTTVQTFLLVVLVGVVEVLMQQDPVQQEVLAQHLLLQVLQLQEQRVVMVTELLVLV